MNKTNKDGYSYIDGNYVKSNPTPEIIVVRKPIIKENKETPKKD